MSNPEPLVTVIIVSYNTRAHLDACLKTLVPDPRYHVVVVDNASSDGSAALVRESYPHVQLMALAANLGYGNASNYALERTATPYALLLNSDTRLAAHAVARLVAYLEQQPRAAIVGPRLLNPDGSLQPSCYPFPTPLAMFLEESALWRLFGCIPLLRERYLRTWAHDCARRVPWVLGAALGIRCEAFRAVGGFDTGFFMYYEEVDLCYRLAAAGWEVHFAPVAEVVHVGGASTAAYREDMLRHLYRNMARYYRKHFPSGQWRVARALLTLVISLRLLRDALVNGLLAVLPSGAASVPGAEANGLAANHGTDVGRGADGPRVNWQTILRDLYPAGESRVP